MLRPADTSQWNESGWKSAFRAVRFLTSRPWMVASRSTRLPINARSLRRGYRLILAGWPLGLLQALLLLPFLRGEFSPPFFEVVVGFGRGGILLGAGETPGEGRAAERPTGGLWSLGHCQYKSLNWWALQNSNPQPRGYEGHEDRMQRSESWRSVTGFAADSPLNRTGRAYAELTSDGIGVARRKTPSASPGCVGSEPNPAEPGSNRVGVVCRAISPAAGWLCACRIRADPGQSRCDSSMPPVADIQAAGLVSNPATSPGQRRCSTERHRELHQPGPRIGAKRR